MRLAALIQRDLSRSRGRFAIVGAAISTGVAILVVFGALGAGVYQGIVLPLLPKLPLNLLKVEPRTVSIGLFAFAASSLGGGLDDAHLSRIGAIEGVAAVYPIVGAGFPLRAEGGERFLGHAIRTDLFATGVAESLVASDVDPSHRFEDPGPNAEKIPVVVARRLLDLYNSTIAPALDKPQLSPEAIIGFSFEIVLGSSYAGGTPDPAKVETKIAEVVGISDQATLVGVTVPEATVRRWNAKHAAGRNPLTGAYVRTKSASDAGPVATAIERGGLKVDDTLKIVGAMVTLASVLALLFALALLSIAGLAIAQTFFLLIQERKTELAILRAMGARHRDLRRLVLLEAGAVGALAGLVGAMVGAASAFVLDAAIMAYLPDIPFRPSHVVALSPFLLLFCWTLGIIAALTGALAPAARAAHADPARALRA